MRRLLLAAIGLAAIWAATVGTIVTSDVVLMDPSSNLQAAIDATPSGGVLVLASGEWSADTISGLVIDHPMTLRGWCRSDTTGGTIIRPYQLDEENPSENAVGIVVSSSDVVIENLCVGNRFSPASTGTGYGIVVDDSLASGNLERVTIRDVMVKNMGGHGIFFDGSADSIVCASVHDVDLVGNLGTSAYFLSTYSSSIYSVHATRNGTDALYCDKTYSGLSSVAP